MCVSERRAPYSDLAFPLAWHGAEGVHGGGGEGDQGLCSLGRLPTSFVVQIPMVSNSQRAMIIVSFVVGFCFFWSGRHHCLSAQFFLTSRTPYLLVSKKDPPQVGYVIPNHHGSWEWWKKSKQKMSGQWFLGKVYVPYPRGRMQWTGLFLPWRVVWGCDGISTWLIRVQGSEARSISYLHLFNNYFMSTCYISSSVNKT